MLARTKEELRTGTLLELRPSSSLSSYTHIGTHGHLFFRQIILHISTYSDLRDIRRSRFFPAFNVGGK